MKKIILLVSHGLVFGAGFALGIYMLPILIAPDSPSVAEVSEQQGIVKYQARFERDLPGSDLLHYGDGEVTVSASAVTFMGDMAPGPDYKLYLLKQPVDTAEGFLKIKENSLQIGDVKTFDRFVVDVPTGVNIDDYSAVLVWCETFGAFISSAAYR